ncbi:MAG: hypothetical protein SGILL_002968 [Bacillariaceae sp.]
MVTRCRGRGVVFQGRGIPYVESFSELTLRELWQEDPFEIASLVVDNVISNQQSDNNGPLLQRVECLDDNNPDTTPISRPLSPSGYEHMFDTLYNPSFQFQFPRSNETLEEKRDNLRSFCLRVAYRGDAFCGWQTQLNNEVQPSVQKTLETYLDPLFVYKMKKSKAAPHKSANLPVAGRTDAGVHAIGQICRFRTHCQDLCEEDIHQQVSKSILGGPSGPFLRVTDVVEVTRAFHPTFTTSCRAYVYLVDVQETGFWSFEQHVYQKVGYLDAILHELEGKDLNYFGLSYGRPKTLDFQCTLHHCRASLVKCSNRFAPNKDDNPDETAQNMAICIELVGSRFLRRMVRNLVQGSMGLVAQKWNLEERTIASNTGTNSPTQTSNSDAFLELVSKKDRGLVSRTAPAHGLLFVGAGLMDT